MTIPVKLKRSGTTTATPSSLEYGEIAINYADGVVFYRDSSDVIQSFTLQAYALSSHTHAASDITSGTLDAARIANDSITYAKLQNVSATDRLLGRSTAGAGVVEEITCTAFGRSLIDDADAAAARTTLGVQPTASPAFTGAASFGNTIAVGATLSSWVSSAGVVQTANYASLSGFNDPSLHLTLNAYYDGANWVYISSAAASNYYQLGGEHVWRGAASGTAGTNVSWTTRLTISSTGTATFAGQVLVTAGSASAPGVAFSGDPNTGMFSPGADQLAFSTNQTERMRIDASGNVYVGSTAGTDRLNVFGVLAHTQTSNGTPALGSKGEYSAIFQNGTGGYGLAIGGVSPVTGGAYVQVQNFSSALAYPLYLQSLGGEVLIGTTTDNGAYLLQVNSQIYATNATIATSDARFKTNVESLNDATAVIEALRPVAFDFIPHAERNFATERQVGLIAQEAQSALAGTDYADSVVARCGDHLGLAYEKLVPVLIKALQESNARIAALEERINA